MVQPVLRPRAPESDRAAPRIKVAQLRRLGAGLAADPASPLDRGGAGAPYGAVQVTRLL